MNISDLIWQRVAEEVDTVFYLPGGGAAYLVDALGRSGLKAVACLHEQGAGYAAVGYAQYKGLGVCLTTSGPGATNAITPCLAAWVDSVPLLVIAGQVMVKWLATPGMRCKGTQEAPILDIVRPITKDAQMIRGAKSAAYYTHADKDREVTQAGASMDGCTNGCAKCHSIDQSCYWVTA